MKNRLHHRDTESTEEERMMCSLDARPHRARRTGDFAAHAFLGVLGVSVVNTALFEGRAAAAQLETGMTSNARLSQCLCASVVRTTP
jgi:hypothetical protein